MTVVRFETRFKKFKLNLTFEFSNLTTVTNTFVNLSLFFWIFQISIPINTTTFQKTKVKILYFDIWIFNVCYRRYHVSKIKFNFFLEFSNSQYHHYHISEIKVLILYFDIWIFKSQYHHYQVSEIKVLIFYFDIWIFKSHYCHYHIAKIKV